MSKILISTVEYNILDTKEKMTVADSFVTRSNKIGSANGEAKFYIGNDNEDTRSFFGEKGFEIKCFLLKKDLIQYLKDCETEYKNPEQPYKNKDLIPGLWEKRMLKVAELDNVLYFTLNEQTQITGARVYVKSDSSYYDLIRELSLPNITYLSAMKVESVSGDISYYFRLFVDYFNSQQHPYNVEKEIERVEEEVKINDAQKTQIIKARTGQGKYRKALLDECPFCPITLISDDRLLIASHIKPWVESNDKEKIDSKNGFMLTPTFDLLFDRGLVSFTDDRKILISPWLSKMTCSKLNISPNKIYPMLSISGRENYLDYHRNNIFKS